MRYGFAYPGNDPVVAVECARAAEDAGWDGYFVWESVWGTDPWVMLGAIAVVTQRIRLGTMLTPVSRRRPWKLAGETATLDRLSNGRAILAVGLGALETGFANFGEVTDRKTRAELLDEGLAIIAGLWQGQPFNFSGKHYQLTETTFTPPPAPVQSPRIPVWVAGGWPRRRSMDRVLRWDGLLPHKMNDDGTIGEMSVDDLRAARAYVDEHRTEKTPFDIVVEGETPGDDPQQAAAKVGPYAAAGATWWLESRWSTPDRDTVLARIRQGPPRLDGVQPTEGSG